MDQRKKGGKKVRNPTVLEEKRRKGGDKKGFRPVANR